MYVVLGASGHTGKVVANHLLNAGQKVRVVSRKAEHVQSLINQGAELAAAEVTDKPSLTSAFKGADAAYVLLPPDMASNDYRGRQDRIVDAVASAIKDAGVKHVVVLSSIGADKPTGTGPIVGLYNLEQKLNRIDGLNALYLRAGYFMENTLPQVMVIRRMGSVAGPIHPDLKLPMIATRDIGKAAADALLKQDFHGKELRHLLGQRDLDYVEAASIIGKAIGKPSLNYVQAPDEQLRPALQQMGMSANMAGLLLEMAGAMNSGYVKPSEPRSSANTTATSFETFAAEQFAPAYQQQPAAA
jgi:uncharacterized protein YbjT (DUF2867 family)